jgi:hypothetical protein
VPKVTFAEYDEKIAGSRLRASIPKRELEKIGVKSGRDVLVYGKHFVTIEQTKLFKKRIFDICNDHFSHSELGKYYREHVNNADLITVNSDEMAKIVRLETGREAMVIPDPYESEELEPGIGTYPFWFGHESNLVDLDRYLPIPGMRILTGEAWSRDKQLAMLKECSCVLIPTGKSMAKSANRLIESVRNGRFVIAGEMPAHDEFKDLMYIGNDLKNSLELFQSSNPVDIVQRIRDCQTIIRDRYSPGRISRLWLEAIDRVWL